VAGRVEIPELAQQAHAVGFLALDELPLEQGDQVVATARLHPVLAQLDDGLGGHGNPCCCRDEDLRPAC
jgi:hypothetical protein